MHCAKIPQEPIPLCIVSLFVYTMSSKDSKPRGSKGKKKEEEKRAALFRSSCPFPLRQRLERALTQRLYLVHHDDIPAAKSVTADTAVNFTVLGSTGNVYTVVVSLQPSCNCPDFCRRHDMCKHIMFVLLKVVGLKVDHSLSYQKAYVVSELKELLTKLRARIRRVGGSHTAVLANEHVQAAVVASASAAAAAAAATDDNEETKQETGVQRRSLDEDADCPICFDDLTSESLNALVYCQSTCGANFHAACIARWLSAASTKSCPNCRQAWFDPNEAKKRSATAHKEAYVNLGALQGMSPERDTSTYYKRQRRHYYHYDYD
jgi:Ring finger domain/SWIM zinc finger